jgi:hypothetical protein
MEETIKRRERTILEFHFLESVYVNPERGIVLPLLVQII